MLAFQRGTSPTKFFFFSSSLHRARLIEAPPYPRALSVSSRLRISPSFPAFPSSPSSPILALAKSKCTSLIVINNPPSIPPRLKCGCCDSSAPAPRPLIRCATKEEKSKFNSPQGEGKFFCFTDKKRKYTAVSSSSSWATLRFVYIVPLGPPSSSSSNSVLWLLRLPNQRRTLEMELRVIKKALSLLWFVEAKSTPLRWMLGM